ncbi:MAG: Hint domain-containing protein, partial [Jannaschia sp.]
DTDADSVTYWHFLFDSHEITFSSGLKSESFFPGAYGMSTFAHETRTELYRLFPQLLHGDHQAAGQTARPVLRAFEYRALSAWRAGRRRSG